MNDLTREGVIKFQLDFQTGPAPAPALLTELNSWRTIFCRLGLMGQDPQRYDGLGFGNLSRRLPDNPQSFLISGTQTGGLSQLSPEHYARVTACDPLSNRASATGQVKPSSESLSHAVLYQADASIDWVMHLHSPDIFHRAADLNLLMTAPDALYGTPEMANSLQQLSRTLSSHQAHLIVMTGHADGLLAFGPDAEQTGLQVLKILAQALRTN